MLNSRQKVNRMFHQCRSLDVLQGLGEAILVSVHQSLHLVSSFLGVCHASDSYASPDPGRDPTDTHHRALKSRTRMPDDQESVDWEKVEEEIRAKMLFPATAGTDSHGEEKNEGITDGLEGYERPSTSSETRPCVNDPNFHKHPIEKSKMPIVRDMTCLGSHAVGARKYKVYSSE